MPPVRVPWTPELVARLTTADGEPLPFARAGLTRRRFLRGALWLVCAPPLAAACGPIAGDGGRADAVDGTASDSSGADATDAAAGHRDAAAPDATDAADAPGGTDIAADVPAPVVVDGWEVPPGTTLEAADFATLAALFDALVPGDPASPGATETHAAWYLDQLLGAFSVTPPRIFAGGPYSGRHGGRDGFSQFLPLTRVEELRWRTWLEGSQGLPEREWNGPVVGLADRYRTGLAALDALAEQRQDRRFAACSHDERRGMLIAASPTFVTMAYEHAVEGTYGDPVYGGNAGQAGWRAIDFEGDRQPVGYTARQLLHPEEG
jgi:hypothetical protein